MKPPAWTGMAMNRAQRWRMFAAAALFGGFGGCGLGLVIRAVTKGVLPARGGGDVLLSTDPVLFGIDLICLCLATPFFLVICALIARGFLLGVYKPSFGELEAARAQVTPVARRR